MSGSPPLSTGGDPMKEFLVLLKRDLLLIKMHCRKRMLMVLFVSAALNLLYCVIGEPELVRRSLIGVDAFSLAENPGIFPVHWILLQLSGVFILYDFVRTDFYEHACGILVRLEKRKRFGQSKFAAGMCVCLVMALLHGCVYAGTGLLWTQMAEGKNAGLRISLYLMSSVFLFMGMTIACSIFQTVSLWLNEGIGVAAAICVLCAGMTGVSPWFPVNQVMPVRSRMLDLSGDVCFWQSAAGFGVLLACLLVCMSVFVSTADVYGKEGE